MRKDRFTITYSIQMSGRENFPGEKERFEQELKEWLSQFVSSLSFVWKNYVIKINKIPLDKKQE